MIAVDAMGADNSPRAIVQGALFAARQRVPIKLFGPKDNLIEILKDLDQQSDSQVSWRDCEISFCNTDQVVEMTEDPILAVKKKINSSLVQAVSSVKRGECSAVISAGSSGALMVASSFILGRKEGVSRPAIVGILPVGNGKVYCLDIGANADCRPEHLLEFALMGCSYVQKNDGKSSPKVALLNIGHEPGKGSLLTKETFKLLKSESRLNFIGNIEPEAVFDGSADVLVCDGFSGNIILKTIEALLKKFNIPSRGSSGGAILLGVKGTVVVAHGNSNASDIEKAIFLAFNASLKEKNRHGVFKKSISKQFS